MLVFQPSTDEKPSFIYRLIRAIQYITAMQRENERLCGILNKINDDLFGQ